MHPWVQPIRMGEPPRLSQSAVGAFTSCHEPEQYKSWRSAVIRHQILSGLLALLLLLLLLPLWKLTNLTMTLEEVPVQSCNEKARRAGEALQEALESAKANECLTIGVYESAKVMNVDPDSVSFCVLAMDEEFECDIALQIHFTLIQAFCFDNDISIVRVSDAQRLAELLVDKAGQLEDAHCVLITMPTEEGSWEDPALEKLHMFCAESRSCHDWVPEVSLPVR
ncbi:growth arrest and DNA damage-inducible protein GADD45 gamma-like [Hoplias malabaricus]|uniref:growth arrest and DNA damage-inducible protein GADD45 gamma-like n=1 Tax=Hoplias malabaricus TaxID=27720 RepID=UPI0034623C9D